MLWFEYQQSIHLMFLFMLLSMSAMLFWAVLWFFSIQAGLWFGPSDCWDVLTDSIFCHNQVASESSAFKSYWKAAEDKVSRSKTLTKRSGLLVAMALRKIVLSELAVWPALRFVCRPFLAGNCFVQHRSVVKLALVDFSWIYSQHERSACLEESQSGATYADRSTNFGLLFFMSSLLYLSGTVSLVPVGIWECLFSFSKSLFCAAWWKKREKHLPVKNQRLCKHADWGTWGQN